MRTSTSVLLWIFSFLFTAGIAVYQRMTGPTYPVSGKAIVNGQPVKYKLIRTYDGDDDARVAISVPDTATHGEIKLRRFKSYDSWTIAPLTREGNELVAYIPHQEMAGKVMYSVTLTRGAERVQLNEHPVIIRYKGRVPMWALIPHIIFIFSAMMFSTRTGLEVLFKGKSTYLYAWITVITLAIGGLFLGPVVQKFSFDAYWTGWPFGHDLTDNKSLVAFIFWVIALFILKKNRENRIWPSVAAIVLLVVFLIPHSVLGSEIDFTKEAKTEAVNK